MVEFVAFSLPTSEATVDEADDKSAVTGSTLASSMLGAVGTDAAIMNSEVQLNVLLHQAIVCDFCVTFVVVNAYVRCDFGF